jgi:hypothetical protein
VSFHLLANHTTSAAAAQTLAQMGLVNDQIISQQNSGFIFTAPYRLGIVYGLEDTMTELRINMPTINAFGRHNVWPFDATGVQPAVIPDLPQIADYLPDGIKLPMNEPMFFEFSDTSAAASDAVALVWLFTPDHRWDIPKGIQRLVVKATPASITPVAYTWSGPSALTFEQNLRGGWYSVNGLNFEAVNVLALRFLFPRAPQYQGRILRPGALSQNAYGRRPNPRFMGRLGVYGMFHTFEPPQVEILAVNATAVIPDMRLDVTYLGDTPADVYPAQAA